jgi:hypothetical protein
MKLVNVMKKVLVWAPVVLVTGALFTLLLVTTGVGYNGDNDEDQSETKTVTCDGCGQSMQAAISDDGPYVCAVCSGGPPPREPIEQ